MEWKSVEKDGLPEPDDDKTYFLKLLDDYGYGTYEEELEFSHYEPLTMTDGKVLNVAGIQQRQNVRRKSEKNMVVENPTTVVL